MKKLKQQEVIRKLRRNFFREAMLRELEIESKMPLSERIEQELKVRKLFTPSSCTVKNSKV